MFFPPEDAGLGAVMFGGGLVTPFHVDAGKAGVNMDVVRAEGEGLLGGFESLVQLAKGKVDFRQGVPGLETVRIEFSGEGELADGLGFVSHRIVESAFFNEGANIVLSDFLVFGHKVTIEKRRRVGKWKVCALLDPERKLSFPRAYMSETILGIEDTVTMHNGKAIPRLGFGTWRMDRESEARMAVLSALEVGYRHIDTAAIYENEEYVGAALRESGLDRESVFVTTKCWNDAIRRGYDAVIKACETSLKKLRLDYVDLYLLHWAIPGKNAEAWRAMETLYERGLVRAIGVSNYMPHHLDELMATAVVRPMVNQVEFHPLLQQPNLLAANRKYGIVHEAWSPLMQGNELNHPVLREIAEAHGKTPAQVVLRWDLQRGVVTIPKSSNPQRILENSRLYDFVLSEEEMRRIDALDQGRRFGPDPDNVKF